MSSGAAPRDFATLFSGHAAEYASFRPRYPTALYAWLAGLVPSHRLAWDAGTGNGQVALALTEHFAHVVATDPSEEQLAQAPRHPQVQYARGRYEPPVAAGSVDLITVGQALHWFDLPAFNATARRVLAPGGVIAAFAYTHSQVSAAVDALVRHHHDITVGAHWAPEHHLIHAGYRTLDLPIRELSAPALEIAEEWTLAQFTGFLRTWSSVQRLIRAEGEAKVVAFEGALAEAWGEAPTRTVRWPLILRVGPLAPDGHA